MHRLAPWSFWAGFGRVLAASSATGLVLVGEIGPATLPHEPQRATTSFGRTRPRYGQTPENAFAAVICTGTLGFYPNALPTRSRTTRPPPAERRRPQGPPGGCTGVDRRRPPGWVGPQ